MPATSLTLYGKAGCCLCEEARAIVAAVAADRGASVEEVDIALDPRLLNRYGERIPVLAVNGEDTLELGFDIDDVRAVVGGVGIAGH